MMVAIVVLLLILALFGLGGLAIHLLWYLLIAALLIWAIGFFIGGAGSGAALGGRRRWYGRW
jgi:hypothetical protein